MALVLYGHTVSLDQAFQVDLFSLFEPPARGGRGSSPSGSPCSPPKIPDLVFSTPRAPPHGPVPRACLHIKNDNAFDRA
jgi:hypothetical protein